MKKSIILFSIFVLIPFVCFSNVINDQDLTNKRDLVIEINNEEESFLLKNIKIANENDVNKYKKLRICFSDVINNLETTNKKKKNLVIELNYKAEENFVFKDFKIVNEKNINQYVIDKNNVNKYKKLIKNLEKKLKEDLKLIKKVLKDNEVRSPSAKYVELNFPPEKLDSFVKMCREKQVGLSELEALVNSSSSRYRVSFSSILGASKKIFKCIFGIMIVAKVTRYVLEYIIDK